MTTLLELPALSAVESTPADFYWRFLSAYPAPNSPVDLSTWTAVFTVSQTLGGDAIVTQSANATANGDISVTLTASQIKTILDNIPSPSRIGARSSSYWQLRLTSSDATPYVHIWQGGLSIARAIA